MLFRSYKRHTNLATDTDAIGAYGTHSETSSATRVQSNFYRPGITDLNNIRDLKYTVVDEYVLCTGNKIIPIRSAKAFEKAFPKLKKDIKEYVNTNKFNAKSPDDVVALMEYCISKK